MYWKSVVVGLCAVGAASAAVPTLGLRNSHDISPSTSPGSFGWNVGFVSTPTGVVAGHTSDLALSRKPVYQRAATSMSALKLGATNLVTFGDVWRATGEEEEDLCDQVLEQQHDATNPIVACGTFLSSVASGIWGRLTADPSPEEVQANLVAFAKAHGGAVMTPMSDWELEQELCYFDD